MGSITSELCKNAVAAVARADPIIEERLRAELVRKIVQVFALSEDKVEALDEVLKQNGGVSAEHRSSECGYGFLELSYWCRLTPFEVARALGNEVDSTARAISNWVNDWQNRPHESTDVRLVHFVSDLDEEPLPTNPNPRETAITRDEAIVLRDELEERAKRLHHRISRLNDQINS